MTRRQSCASGGVASVFSQYIVDTGGLVCGCGFDTDFVPRHFISWEYEQLTKFKGSKYVQSYIGDTFKQIKQQLTRGKHLLSWVLHAKSKD